MNNAGCTSTNFLQPFNLLIRRLSIHDGVFEQIPILVAESNYYLNVISAITTHSNVDYYIVWSDTLGCVTKAPYTILSDLEWVRT